MSGFHVCESGGYISFEPATTTSRLKLGTVNMEDVYRCLKSHYLF